MDIVVFEAHQLPVALAALRALFPEPSARQDQLIHKLASLHGATLRVSALPGPSLDLLRATLRDPHRRKRLVQLAIVMALVDGQIAPASTQAVLALAAELDVREPALTTLRSLIRGHVLRARFGLARRMFSRFLRAAFRAERFTGLFKMLAAYFNFLTHGQNAAIAARYAQLANFPEDSLGRALFRHCESLNLSLPGQPGAIPEQALFHDVGHILSGYGIDPKGEMQQAAFQAGFVRSDGFAFLFFGMLQFHLGIQITPVARPEHACFEVEAALTALARGAACNVDLSERWNFWSWARHSVPRVRTLLEIPALDANGLGQTGTAL